MVYNNGRHCGYWSPCSVMYVNIILQCRFDTAQYNMTLRTTLLWPRHCVICTRLTIYTLYFALVDELNVFGMIWIQTHGLGRNDTALYFLLHPVALPSSLRTPGQFDPYITLEVITNNTGCTLSDGPDPTPCRYTELTSSWSDTPNAAMITSE